MTAREDVVEPTIIAFAASLLDTPASASSFGDRGSAPAALEIHSKLRKPAEFRVTVDRRGTELELVIRVVE